MTDSTEPPLHERVFVNRNLRFDTVRTIGFDMDYTLARYHRDELERLAHRLTMEKLVGRGYPEEILKFEYTPNFVIRGLTVDKQNGCILKLDRHNHVGRVYLGRSPLPKRQRRSWYRREKLHFVPPRFALVDTIFALPEVCIYADLVGLLGHGRRRVDMWKLFDDTRECIDEAHRDESLKSVVKADLGRYIERDPNLPRTLHKLRSAGKRLFLLTNSGYDYTHQVMRFLLDGALGEYPNWRSYFEVVVVDAKKPGFFTRTEPFAQISDAGAVVRRPVARFGRGLVYQGGNLVDFERAIGYQGEDILYVGDHIYGDILKSKQTSLWRTALIVEELEDELKRTSEHREALLRMSHLEHERRDLAAAANQLRRSLSTSEREGGTEAKRQTAYTKLRRERDDVKRRTKEVLTEMNALNRGINDSFNPHWGMVFKEDNERSRFGEQVTNYACIYTSRVTNFRHYSAYQYFRSRRDYLPHEWDLFGDA
jgi:HAD superfamily 5'-nucleotidase-like hydrolase